LMIASIGGLPKERFTDLQGEAFDCSVCCLVCVNPKECLKCGTMYCGPCIDDWLSKKNECPMGCTDARANIKIISGALAKIYKNLDVRCKYETCQKVVKLSDLEQHELSCQLPKCEFFEQCGNQVKDPNQKEKVCSLVCSFLKKIKDSEGNWKTIYDEIKGLKTLQQQSSASSPLAKSSQVSQMNQCVILDSCWDNTRMGSGMEVTNNKKTVFLKENAYMFRSVISTTPMTGGIHYWEIIADPRTENELKIGVATRRDFNYNTAFCDYDFGFAYYGLAQLRHGSNSVGGPYGKKFKKTGVLGVCLNMNQGSLSFALDGDYWGEAYRSEDLKKGPIFIAVALLHQAGCTLETGKQVPSYFLKK